MIDDDERLSQLQMRLSWARQFPEKLDPIDSGDCGPFGETYFLGVCTYVGEILFVFKNEVVTSAYVYAGNNAFLDETGDYISRKALIQKIKGDDTEWVSYTF